MRAAEARTIPRPAAIVSCEVQLRRVVGGERGREPALGPVRRGLGQRAGGDQGDVGALARGGQRGVEPGGAGAHDDEVGPVHGEVARTVSACPGPSGCATRSRSPTRCRATRSGRSGSSRWRRRWSATTGSGATSCGRRRRRASSCSPCTRPRTSTTSRSCARPAAGTIDYDTVAMPATYEAAVRSAGGAVALVDALLSRRGGDGLLGACARPGTTPSRRGRWGSASSATWRWRRGTRAPRTASSGC